MFTGLTGRTIQGARKPLGATLGVYAFAFNSSTVEFTVSKTKAPSYTSFAIPFSPRSPVLHASRDPTISEDP
jgi:hypothetical protein